MPHAFTIVAAICLCAQAFAAQVPLQIANPRGEAVMAWPITTGVPFPTGALASADNVRVLDERGAELPCQANVTAR